MRIAFGWGFDGTAWAPSGHNTLGEVTVGPNALADILATRFALSQPQADPIRRRSAYRRALARAFETQPDLWAAESFRVDPWTVAGALLTWRDRLVESGWQPTVEAGMPHRLRSLAVVEKQLEGEAAFGPSSADQLYALESQLRGLVAHKRSWPTGIEQITVYGERDSLPLVWRCVLEHLAALGTKVIQHHAPDSTNITIEIYDADTVWAAAPVAARLIKDLSGTPLSVIAGASTQLLDAELHRLGQPGIGVREAHEDSLGQTVITFLRAVSSPTDVHAIIALFNTQVATAAGSYSRPLVPRGLSGRLVRALEAEAGVVGEQWSNAVREAIEGEEDELAAEQYRELAALIKAAAKDEGRRGDGGYATTKLNEALAWLLPRLDPTDRQRIEELMELFSDVGELVTEKERDQIIKDFFTSHGMSVTAALAPGRAVFTDPAQLGPTGRTEVAVWWIPQDDSSTNTEDERPGERIWLEDRGVHLPTAEELARLLLDAQLAALGNLRRLIAVTARRISGTQTALHPALSFITHRMEGAQGTTTTQPAELPEELVHRPQPHELAPRDPIHRAITPGEQLIPEKVSYSQWRTLLNHPLEWVLSYGLGLKTGGQFTVPTGNRMIGLWLHATVEALVKRRREEDEYQPGGSSLHLTKQEISEELAALVPTHASELLLPGHAARRGALMDLATESLNTLFAQLDEASVRVNGSEVEFDDVIIGGVPGRNGHDMTLTGSRDVDVTVAGGQRGVIDLKYSGSRSKYEKEIIDGLALQLAVYAVSLTDPESGTGLSSVPAAYFNLRTGVLDTAYEDLVPTGHRVHGDIHDLSRVWDRAVAGMTHILSAVREGRVTDIGNILALNGDDTDPDFDFAKIHGLVPDKSTANYTNYDVITGKAGEL